MAFKAYYENTDSSECEAILEEIVRPLFYVDFSVLDTYNGEFGFDKYNKKTHKEGFPGYQYVPHADIQAEYVASWLCIWPPQVEYSTRGIPLRSNKATIQCNLIPAIKKTEYNDNVRIEIPVGLTINGTANTINLPLRANSKTNLNIECTQALSEDAEILFYDNQNKRIGVLKVKANNSDNIQTTTVKLFRVYLTDVSGNRLNPDFPNTITPNGLSDYFNNRAFNQALVYVTVDPIIDDIDLPQASITGITSTINAPTIESSLTAGEMKDFLKGVVGDVTVINLNENNKKSYIEIVAPRERLRKDIEDKDKIIKDKTIKRDKQQKELTKKEEQLEKLKNENKDNQEKISNKLEIEKGDRKREKLKQQQLETKTKYDKKIAEVTLKRDEDQKKLKVLNSDLGNEIAERSRLDNLRNTLVYSHSIYMCNDLFGAYSTSSLGGTTSHNLVAGFARPGDYNCCLFNPAIRLTRHDLFTHELGHNFGLREISEDIGIGIGDSKENFMDYKIIRRSFHYWQWDRMLGNLIMKQRRINKQNNS